MRNAQWRPSGVQWRRQFILARPEMEGGPRKRWEGYLCFFIHTCCGYNGEVVAFSPLCLIPLSLVLRSCRYGTSFVRSDKGCKALFFIDTTRHFQNIPVVRLQQQTTKRLGCTIYPRIRLIKFIPQMLTIAKGSAF